MNKTSNDEFIQHLNDVRNDVIALDPYNGLHKKIRFLGKCMHIWPATPAQMLYTKSGCPYCSNKLVLVGFNDLWTTHPHIAKLLKNPEDGYKYTYGCGVKLYFICPNCGAILFKSLNNICKQGFSCNVCSDGISYPNKFSRALLQQLKVNNVAYEWQPEWLKPYFYDNYFEYNNNKYVLEMDGGIGHGNRQYKSNINDIDGKIIDEKKDVLAAEYGINVIRVDCYYDTFDRFEYIKSSIINSKISEIIDLSDVNWEQCNLYATSSMVIRASELYNDGYASSQMVEILCCSAPTVRNWLKQATKIGLCNYDKYEFKSRSMVLTRRKVNQYSLEGIFIATFESADCAAQYVGLKGGCRITSCCRGYYGCKTAGGFLWFYADDPDQPDKSKIIPNNTKLIKEVS